METKKAGSAPCAADIMTPGPRTCTPFSSVLEAVMIFRDGDCGAVPIIEDGKPVAVVTDRDIALALADHAALASLELSEIMTRGIVAVSPDATLEEIRQALVDEGVRRLLVVDTDDRLVGIIGLSDLARVVGDRWMGDMLSQIVSTPPQEV